MQQFVVPQFIDVEDKIIGPLTVRQFAIMTGGGVLGFVFYKIFDFVLFLICVVIILLLIWLFAFFKVGGYQVFHEFLLNFIKTKKRPTRRVWGKEYSLAELKEFIKPIVIKKKAEIAVKAPLQTRHLSDVSLMVDTGGAYEGEE